MLLLLLTDVLIRVLCAGVHLECKRCHHPRGTRGHPADSCCVRGGHAALCQPSDVHEQYVVCVQVIDKSCDSVLVHVIYACNVL